MIILKTTFTCSSISIPVLRMSNSYYASIYVQVRKIKLESISIELRVTKMKSWYSVSIFHKS